MSVILAVKQFHQYASVDPLKQRSITEPCSGYCAKTKESLPWQPLEFKVGQLFNLHTITN